MPKRRYRRIAVGHGGFTLLEVMVSTGLAGIIMVALMYLLWFAGKFGGDTSRNLETVEGVADAVGQFTNVLTQVTRITSCKCQSNTSSRAACIWDPLGSNVWYDPVIDGGVAQGGVIFAGEFEAYDGALNLATGLTNQFTANISLPSGTCATTHSNMAAGLLRGCKLPFSVNYWAPTQSGSGTPSLAGQVMLTMGTTNSVSIGATKTNGANGLGVTELSCGFEVNGGRMAGTNFVLNMHVKARTNSSEDTNSFLYETWYPRGAAGCATSSSTNYNYCKGKIRQVQLRAEMRNLTHRGIYFWRAEGVRNCQPPNATVTSANQCCSQAAVAGVCKLCLPAGAVSGAAGACCSGTLNAGNCL